jgi:hypothetical protein
MESTVKSGLPEGSMQSRGPNELVHLIRKLRWMGMEDEAKIVQEHLAACHPPPGDNVIGGPTDTD